MSKYTPGPWKVVFSPLTACGNCHLIKQDDSVERPIACLWEGGGTKGKPTQIANARLIASAPELLEACKALLRFNEELCQDVNVSIHYPSAKKARQAIKKAEANDGEA